MRYYLDMTISRDRVLHYRRCEKYIDRLGVVAKVAGFAAVTWFGTIMLLALI
tara:strand:+ start:410 stop:565 length:156 start_codon:yes stop_codon:yes gene_type:complete